MRGLRRLLVGGAVLAGVVVTMAGPATAVSSNACRLEGEPHGAYVSDVARTEGHSGDYNPGVDGAISSICKGPRG